MSFVRTAILALFGLCVLVGLVFVCQPFLFRTIVSVGNNGVVDGVSSLPYHNVDVLDSCEDGVCQEASLQSDASEADVSLSSYVRISSSPELNPTSGSYFVVSFLVRFRQLPQDRQRHNIIEKYDSERFPYSGWAIGVTRINGLIRPQVYWRDGYGHGGWFNFDSFDCQINNWYAVTLVSHKAKYISVYVEPFGQKLSESLEDNTGYFNYNIYNSIARSSKDGESSVVFLGGQPTFDIAPPATGATLELAVTKASGQSFNGDVELFLIATPRELNDSVKILQSQLRSGPLGLRLQLKGADIALAINSAWRDESHYAREIDRAT